VRLACLEARKRSKHSKENKNILETDKVDNKVRVIYSHVILDNNFTQIKEMFAKAKSSKQLD